MKAADSLYVAEYIRQWNDSNNAHLDYPDFYGLTGGKITYAPDNRFRTAVFSLEYCGAYCNSESISFIQYRNGDTEISLPAEISTVYSIMPVKCKRRNEYLILSSDEVRPRGFEIVQSWKMLHVRLTEHGPEFTPFRSANNTLNHFLSADRSNICENAGENFIRFDPQRQTIDWLSYEVIETDDGMYCEKHTGRLIYRNGQFTETTRK